MTDEIEIKYTEMRARRRAWREHCCYAIYRHAHHGLTVLYFAKGEPCPVRPDLGSLVRAIAFPPITEHRGA